MIFKKITSFMANGFHPFLKLKRFLPKSLFGRFVMILLVPLLTVQVILGYIFFDRHTDTVIRLLSDTIAGNIALVKNMVEEDKPLKAVQKIAKNHLSFEVTLTPKGHLVESGQAKDTWLYDHMAKALDDQLQSPFFLRMDREFIYIDVQAKNSLIHIKTLRKRLFSKTTNLVLIWTTASAFLLFLVAMIFMRNQIRPITRLADAAERFGKGQQIVAFKPEGAREVRKAAKAFNQMRVRILRFVEERTLQLAGVSHDLRTPLTRMQLQLALMEKSDAVTHLQEDIDQMTRMVQGFLDFARNGADENSIEVDMNKNIDGVISSFLQAHPMDIEWDAERNATKNITLCIKNNLFNRMLTNVLINSYHYAKKVRVTLAPRAHFVEVIVDDDGPGIPKEKWEDVFQPFHRLDPSRSAETGGAGLGLTIVRDVMHVHGGRVSLGVSPWGGLRVSLWFPK